MLFTPPDFCDDSAYRRLSRVLGSYNETKTGLLSEMSDFERAFLSGLLKKHNPHKVLEVGVAAGGTTCVILSTLAAMCSDAPLTSVDISEAYYHNDGRKSGFLVEELVPELKGRWTLRAGRPLPAYLEEIGRGIDFAVLDTSHVLPGELLDFIVLLPYLTERAIVVLHDIHAHFLCDVPAYATKVVLDTVVGHKIVCKDSNRPYGLPNIGAVVLTSASRKHVSDLFGALTMPWFSLPSEDDLAAYRDSICKNYDACFVEYFDMAVNAARHQEKDRLWRYAKP